MEPQVLLSQLKSLLARAPDFAAYAPAKMEYHAWLGQAHALVAQVDQMDAIGLKTAADFLGFQANRDYNISQIFGAIYRAIAALEAQLPADAGQAFGPGAIYDFFKALSSVLASAKKSLLVADPYMDDSVFDAYLSGVPRGVAVRLLVGKYSAKVKPAAEKFIAQYGAALEVRSSNGFHDRLMFVDGDVCWVLGQSIKDAAAAKPTYLAPLSPDVGQPKLADYETIWKAATAI